MLSWMYLNLLGFRGQGLFLIQILILVLGLLVCFTLAGMGTLFIIFILIYVFIVGLMVALFLGHLCVILSSVMYQILFNSLSFMSNVYGLTSY